eukprot:3487814-Prymnesium_polylepis.1
MRVESHEEALTIHSYSDQARRLCAARYAPARTLITVKQTTTTSTTSRTTASSQSHAECAPRGSSRSRPNAATGTRDGRNRKCAYPKTPSPAVDDES